MLSPKITKFRKSFKIRKFKGQSKGGNNLNLGIAGLQAVSPGMLNSAQIEATRRAISRKIKKIGQLYIRVFPQIPVSKKPAEVRMGGGKGNVEFWACKILPGKILFEIGGVDEKTAKEILKGATYKLPFKTKIITKEMEEKQNLEKKEDVKRD